MRAGIFTTTVQKVVDMGIQKTRHFQCAFEPGTAFDFEAGQFANVMLEMPDGSKTLKRPYSIASSPYEKGHLDLCWKLIENGAATNILWKIKEGDSLKIQGPLGRFTVRRPLPKRIVFVSTGTGIAPFRSMIKQLLHDKAKVEICNLFGNRYDEDILYREEFERLEKEHSNFKNIFTVSRPKQWKGEKDYVQVLLKKYFPDPAGKHIYICGLSKMIQDVQQTALSLGYTKDQILFEKYD